MVGVIESLVESLFVLRIDFDLCKTFGSVGKVCFRMIRFPVSFWTMEDCDGSLTELDFFLGVEVLPLPPFPVGSRWTMSIGLGFEPLGPAGAGGLRSFLPLGSLGLL